MRAWVSTLRKGFRHFADRTRTETLSGRALIRSFHISHYLAACGSFGLSVVRSLPVFPISGPDWRQPSFSTQKSKSEIQFSASKHAEMLSGQVKYPLRDHYRTS